MPITPETDLNERQWQVEGTGELIVVHPGVAIPTVVRAGGPLSTVPATGTGRAGPSTGFRLEVEAVYVESRGHYMLRAFSVVAPEDGEVTGALLRTAAPLWVLRWILPRTFQFDEVALSDSVVDFIAPEFKQHRLNKRDAHSTTIDLTDVGTVYRLATIVRYPPAKAVAETFDLQARTATNWIVRARASGLA